jgi:cytochrome c556
MKKLWGVFAVATLGVAALVLAGPASADDKDEKEPKAIKQIMKEAHAGRANSLRAKVLSGKASKEEMAKLLVLYADLGKNTPPKGEKEAWKKRTTTIVKAAQAFSKEKTPKNRQALNVATNCMTCHRAFRAR